MDRKKKKTSATAVSEKLLSAYFRGDISDEQAVKVLEWVEEDEDNFAQYMALRKVYDSMLMSEEVRIPQSSHNRHHTARKVIAYISAAAAITAAVIFGYHIRESYIPQTPQMTMSADNGCRNECFLEDGTRVVLNSGAELDIMEMSGKTREVALRGEAYFNVAHDKARPFIVNTGKMSISVLGTEFNVNTGGDDHTVVLVNGSINVRTTSSGEDSRHAWLRKGTSGKGITIVPGDMFSTCSGGTVTRVDTRIYTSWMSGYIILDRTPVTDVIEKIAGYYGKRIRFDGEKATDLTITGKLDMDGGIDAALDNLCALAPLTYRAAIPEEADKYDIIASLRQQ